MSIAIFLHVPLLEIDALLENPAVKASSERQILLS